MGQGYALIRANLVGFKSVQEIVVSLQVSRLSEWKNLVP